MVLLILSYLWYRTLISDAVLNRINSEQLRPQGRNEYSNLTWFVCGSAKDVSSFPTHYWSRSGYDKWRSCLNWSKVTLRWHWGDIEVTLRWHWGDIEVTLRWHWGTGNSGILVTEVTLRCHCGILNERWHWGDIAEYYWKVTLRWHWGDIEVTLRWHCGILMTFQ